MIVAKVMAGQYNGKYNIFSSRLHLDTKLNFQEHLDNIMSKVDKTIGLLRKLQAVLRHPFLVTIYKRFIRPHLNYGDIIYDQAYKETFHQKLESIQYNAAPAETRSTRGTSREKPYQELDLESLQKHHCYRRKLCYFLKKVSLRIIFPKYFLVEEEHITQEMLITFPVSIPSTSFFKEFFFPIKFNSME